MIKRILFSIFLVLCLATPGWTADGERVVEGIMADAVSSKMFKTDINTESLSANKVLAVTDVAEQRYVLDQDRDCTLPPEADSTDLKFTLYNDSTVAGRDLTVKTDAPVTIVTLGPGMGMVFSCDGTTWLAMDNEGILYDAIAGTHTFSGGLVVTGGTNTFNLANGTAFLDVAAGSAVDINANLTVESTATVNQDTTSDASPTFVTTKLSGLGDGFIPYHIDDSTGFANSPISTDGTDLDVHGALIKGVADAVDPTDAANLQTVLEQTGISLHYYLGDTTLDQELTESEAFIPETQDEDPDLLSLIFFVAAEANTPTPFTVGAGMIIPVHFSAKVTTGGGSKYETVLYVKLGYVDDDGFSTFIQIGVNSDNTAILTTDQTSYAVHIHVVDEIVVPLTKRLYLQVWADSSGTGDYDEINFYVDSVPYHVQFAIGASVLENFVRKTGDTMTGPLTTTVLTTSATSAPSVTSEDSDAAVSGRVHGKDYGSLSDIGDGSEDFHRYWQAMLDGTLKTFMDWDPQTETFSIAGDLMVTGEIQSVNYKTFYIDAGAMISCTTNGAATGTNEYGTNDIEWDYFAFDNGATEERVQFKLVMPEDWDASTLKVKFYWSSATGSSVSDDQVSWAIKAGALVDSAVIDAALGTARAVEDTLLASDGTDLQITGATPALTVGGAALGSLVTFEIFRDTNGDVESTTDDMTEDAWLFGVLIQYATASTSVAAW